MSYKVSAIIIPFCRNLLSPAMVAAFFVTSDDGLAEKLQEACKNRHGHKALAPCSHRQPDQGRTFRDFFDVRKRINGATDDQPWWVKKTRWGIIVFVKGKAHWHISSTTAWHTILSGRASRSQNDFATSRFARRLQPVIVYNLRATGCGTYSVSLMHILCKRQPWKWSAVALRNWQTHLSSLFAIEIFSSRFALMFEMEIRLFFIEWSDRTPSTTAVSAVVSFDGCYFPLFKMRCYNDVPVG